jgi:hypothetical protein
VALTQQRLMDEEAYSEEDAFVKCEHEIFKEELYVRLLFLLQCSYLVVC